MPKNDRRVRYTKQAIKDSLFDMLETIPVEQITVKALCEKAEINRATFYTHYETLSTLIEEVEYEECKQLFDLLDQFFIDSKRDDFYHATKTMLQFLKDHRIMRKLFLHHKAEGRGLSRLTWEHLKKTHGILTSSGLTDEQAYWLLAFVVYGMREVLRQWFDSDMENEDAFIQTITDFVHAGLSAFI